MLKETVSGAVPRGGSGLTRKMAKGGRFVVEDGDGDGEAGGCGSVVFVVGVVTLLVRLVVVGPLSSSLRATAAPTVAAPAPATTMAAVVAETAPEVAKPTGTAGNTAPGPA